MADFFDVTLGNDRRKAALQQLLQQYGGRSNLGQAATALPLFGGGRGARNEADLPSAPLPPLTTPFPIDPGVLARLGPGVGGPGPGTPGTPGSGGAMTLGHIYAQQPGNHPGSVVRRLFGAPDPNAPVNRGNSGFGYGGGGFGHGAML